ncbi:unnamed protein product [Bursaphelenchus xylophilus]|nr:unnamed protein product [Bursaphelenchus xylophilus]CAG9114014.1 unnamed protein product [Bursaphelenchus xylophilus]
MSNQVSPEVPRLSPSFLPDGSPVYPSANRRIAVDDPYHHFLNYQELFRSSVRPFHQIRHFPPPFLRGKPKFGHTLRYETSHGSESFEPYNYGHQLRNSSIPCSACTHFLSYRAMERSRRFADHSNDRQPFEHLSSLERPSGALNTNANSCNGYPTTSGASLAVSECPSGCAFCSDLESGRYDNIFGPDQHSSLTSGEIRASCSSHSQSGTPNVLSSGQAPSTSQSGSSSAREIEASDPNNTQNYALGGEIRSEAFSDSLGPQQQPEFISSHHPTTSNSFSGLQPNSVSFSEHQSTSPFPNEPQALNTTNIPNSPHIAATFPEEGNLDTYDIQIYSDPFSPLFYRRLSPIPSILPKRQRTIQPHPMSTRGTTEKFQDPLLQIPSGQLLPLRAQEIHLQLHCRMSRNLGEATTSYQMQTPALLIYLQFLHKISKFRRELKQPDLDVFYRDVGLHSI